MPYKDVLVLYVCYISLFIVDNIFLPNHIKYPDFLPVIIRPVVDNTITMLRKQTLHSQFSKTINSLHTFLT